MDVRHYLSPDGRDPFQDWIDGLEDVRTRVAVLRRIDRLALGSVGDCRFCRSGVWELRIDLGPGYRVYYAKAGNAILLLLAGGSKRTQQADIGTAGARWKDYRSRR
ncbi:MAG TPA: type II toxin-antitoxin system RelE/ParE family toxin [Steroidobacteraceae bacterium]|nr:type II toxin-antitoxin system RelE/ParE family toxin [Steroidobacteraceae bacterium]